MFFKITITSDGYLVALCRTATKKNIRHTNASLFNKTANDQTKGFEKDMQRSSPAVCSVRVRTIVSAK